MYTMSKAMEFSDELKLVSPALQVNGLWHFGIFLNPLNSEVRMVFWKSLEKSDCMATTTFIGSSPAFLRYQGSNVQVGG